MKDAATPPRLAAINRQQIVDNVLKGVGQPLYTPETPAAIFFDKDLKPYGQDLAESEALLKKGGFVHMSERLADSQIFPRKHDARPVAQVLNPCFDAIEP